MDIMSRRSPCGLWEEILSASARSSFLFLCCARRSRTSSVSRHHLHVAAIPTNPATTAPLFQCRAIHEGIRARELIMSLSWTDLSARYRVSRLRVRPEDYKRPTPSAIHGGSVSSLHVLWVAGVALPRQAPHPNKVGLFRKFPAGFGSA